MRRILLVIVSQSLRVSALKFDPLYFFRGASPTKFAHSGDSEGVRRQSFTAGQADVEFDSDGDTEWELEQVEADNSNEYALRFVQNPTPTLLEDIPDTERSEAASHDIAFVRHSHFDVTIPIYQGADTISDAIRTNGSWDTVELQRICDAFSEYGGRGHILDVGANIGSYSLPLASFVKSHSAGNKGSVVAVEGFPKNAQHLRAGIRFNNLDNVYLYEYALSSPIEENTVEMKEHRNNKGMNKVSLPLRTGRRSKNRLTTVPVTTLDAIAGNNPELLRNIFLMKMDIEGSEAEALRGALRFFEKGPCIVYVETKYNDKLVSIFEQKGYVLQTLEGPDKNAWFEASDIDDCVASLE